MNLRRYAKYTKIKKLPTLIRGLKQIQLMRQASEISNWQFMMTNRPAVA